MINVQISSMQNDCKECFKIKCRNCSWEPNKKELSEITEGSLIKCPDCGWKP